MSIVRHFLNVACKNYEVWARMLGLFINTKFNCTSVHNNDKMYIMPLKVIHN